MATPTFDQFLGTIRRLGGATVSDPVAADRIHQAAAARQALPSIDRTTLAEMVRAHPDWVPVLGSCVGLSQEQLKNNFKFHFNSSGWVTLVRTRAADVIEKLDEEFDVVARIRAERHRDWTFSDILVERSASRSRAGGAINRGRAVEDEVERLVAELGLTRDMRTRFDGRVSQTGPCDLAIPGGGAQAQIVCAIKGFDSTGSKLTAAAAEIEAMANVRKPSQFVYAVVDGIGWPSRQGDLRRIHRLWDDQAIDGVYTLSTLPHFGDDLRQAARRLGLLSE